MFEGRSQRDRGTHGIPPNKTRARQVSFPGILARGGTHMGQLARVQSIRNVFQKILCVPDRWKGTERRGFARDNNLQAFFVRPTRSLWGRQ